MPRVVKFRDRKQKGGSKELGVREKWGVFNWCTVLYLQMKKFWKWMAVIAEHQKVDFMPLNCTFKDG